MAQLAAIEQPHGACHLVEEILTVPWFKVVGGALGPLLGEAHMAMRDWGADDRPASIWMRIEFTLLLSFAVGGLVALAFAVPLNAHLGVSHPMVATMIGRTAAGTVIAVRMQGSNRCLGAMGRCIIRIAMQRAGRA